MDSILIIRLSAIGDIVMASGVVPALRAAYPTARIDWLVQSEFQDLLQATADVHRVIPWPRRKWKQELASWHWGRVGRELLQFVGLLRKEGYDLVLDMQGLLKSGIWARLSGGKTVIGLDSREGSRLLMSKVVHSQPGDKDIASEYKALLQTLQVPATPYELGLEASSDDTGRIQTLLDRIFQGQIPPGLALFCPFTTRAQKHWFEDRWIELAERVTSQMGFSVLILGGPTDKEAGERLAACDPGPVFNLAGETTLRQCLALIKGASLLIGVDTGLTHMGVLSGIPTVALFGSTCPYLHTDNPRARILYSSRECSPCRRIPVCNEAFECMRDLTLEQVSEAAWQAMQTEESHNDPDSQKK